MHHQQTKMRVLVNNPDPGGAQHPACVAVEFKQVTMHIRQVELDVALDDELFRHERLKEFRGIR